MKKSIKALVAVLVVLIVLFTLVFVFYYKYQNAGAHVFKDPQVSEGTSDIAQQEQPEENKNTIMYNGQEYEYNENVVNILMLGIDSDKWRETQRMGWRSDMMMLCTLDFEKNTITLTSIPRDTRTEVKHLDKDTGEVTKTNIDKINSAYAYGQGPNHFGAENAMDAAKTFLSCDGQFNIPIDYYMSIDLEGVPKFAEALGGVEVTLDVNFPGLGSKGDTVVLGENSARAYLENRKQVGGELVRVSHEQQFIRAVANKIKSMGAVSAATKLYSQLLEFMKTNMNLDQILACAKVVDGSSIEAMTMQTINGDFDYIDGVSYFIPDMDDVAQKVVEVLYVPVA